MKFLIVGEGGREHALAWKLRQSPLVTRLFIAPGNAGTALEGENVPLPTRDIPSLVSFARENAIDLTVVGPEAPLIDGIVDAFEEARLPIFGPSRLAAQIEGSKIYSKELMRQSAIPTADFQVFRSAEAAEAYVGGREEARLVVKADGLASGKGVCVCANKAEALAAIRRIMREREFGTAGQKIVIEERLDGQEVSILALTDGQSILPLESAQDHKAAYDDDRGPNTGGMGAYSPVPAVTPDVMDQIIAQILVPTIHAMKRDRRPFRGILYAGLMLTHQGPKVLEFNARFGDPECQPLLMRLKSDLAMLLLAAARGELAGVPALEWDPRPSVCVVMASAGYPEKYTTGHVIRGLDDAAAIPATQVFHAGTERRDGAFVTRGGRVLGVTSLGETLAEAKYRAYQAVKCIRWEGAWCRHDISDKARARLRPTS